MVAVVTLWASSSEAVDLDHVAAATAVIRMVHNGWRIAHLEADTQ